VLTFSYYIFCALVCSLRYPACNAHAPYCHPCPAPLYNIFPHYLINGTIFVKKLLNTKCVFWFSLQFLSETFLILRRTERDIIKNVFWSSCEVPVICQISMKPELKSFENTQISWKSVQWEPDCSMPTDGQTEKYSQVNKGEMIGHVATHMGEERCT